VTPGIRYPEGSIDDQARVTTPSLARELGSDYIVVGRPITAAPDPKAAWQRIKTDFLG
jgi:orotidine-5'-phosphate decarboxylase